MIIDFFNDLKSISLFKNGCVEIATDEEIITLVSEQDVISVYKDSVFTTSFNSLQDVNYLNFKKFVYKNLGYFDDLDFKEPNHTLFGYWDHIDYIVRGSIFKTFLISGYPHDFHLIADNVPIAEIIKDAPGSFTTTPLAPEVYKYRGHYIYPRRVSEIELCPIS